MRVEEHEKKVTLTDDDRFWIELSFRYSTPVSLLKTLITTDEFEQLIEYYSEELRGEKREDYRQAIASWHVANMLRAPKTSVIPIESFLIRPPEPAMTAEQMENVLRAGAERTKICQ